MSRTLAALATTTVVLAALAPGTAAADGTSGASNATPGAAGIGDPYFPLDGNGGYEVGHYDLDLRYDPATDVLTGVATIQARATQALSSFNLDLQGLEVRSVAVDHVAAIWTREGGELTVTPVAALPEQHDFTVVISYDGVPATIPRELGGSGFLHTDDGALVAGEPDAAATWFPANDHPLDPASVDLAVTVPEGLEAISNGVLEGARTEDGWTTWEWCAQDPMAPYLVTLAIGEFDVREYEAGGLRYWDALDPDLFTLDADPLIEGPSMGEVAEASLARQPEIIDFLSGLFGPYPFGSAGGIVDDVQELRFALETQTRPVYSPMFFQDPVSGDVVVVHELAHQWVGDDVRLEAWRHIWLNEGFATYAQWLWLEREGLSTPQQEFDTIASWAPDDFWTVAIGDPGASTEQLFHPAVYYRGAMTLHALRLAVGDEAFFRILREWTSSQAGDVVDTGEFISLAEATSGRQLDDLFHTWLFTAGKPAGLPTAAPSTPPS